MYIYVIYIYKFSHCCEQVSTFVGKQGLQINKPATAVPQEGAAESEVPKDIFDFYEKMDKDDENTPEETQVYFL